MSEEREIIFKAFYWSFEDIEEDDTSKLVFHVSGMTKEQKTVQIQIENFKPHVYLQLPKRINWDKLKCKKVVDYFKNTMKRGAPVDYRLKKKDILYYKKEALFIYLSFSTSKACKDFIYRCSQKLFINGIGSFQPDEFLVHEHNIDPILKFTASKKIHLADWISVKETIHEDESELSIEDRKFSTSDIDMYVDYQDVEPYIMKEVVILKPLYCSFDIECYSTNHNSKLPDPDEPENKVFQISMYFGKFNDDTYHKSYLLSLFNPFEIEGSTLVKFKTEKDLLMYFSKLIRKKDPLFFEGYNIMKFDWTYMIKRAKFLGIQPNFLNISRLIGKKAELCKVNWSSSAYGEQEFLYPDCHGRTQLDVILEVERNFKLPIYSLNAVAERFLGEHKDDITPRQLFMFYKITQDILPLINEDTNLKELQKRIKSILPFRKTHGVVRKHRRKMLNCEDHSTLKSLVRECLTMTLKYCKQDTILPVKLVDKLKLLTTMEAMSNVMHIPMSYLHTRGQQIKVLAQVYRETFHNNLVIPFNKKNPNKKKENYEGAIVAEAHAGDYDNVGTVDFFSLYPSIMIAFNICHTTLIEDKNTPDEDCYVLEWTSHVGCSHDPLKRKKKKNNQDIMVCGDFKCRFKRVVTNYNESTGTIIRENEGILPRMLRNLLMSRSDVKKEMFKEEARLKMNRGTASDEDMEIYKKCKFEIIEKDSLSEKEDKELETKVNVLNAKQLAIKVSANSTYGSLGADQGYIPLISGAASVTAMGRQLITMANKKIRDTWKNCKIIYGDTDSLMIIFQGCNMKESFDKCIEASKVATHFLKSWILKVDENYKVDIGNGKFISLNKINSKSEYFSNLSLENKIKVLDYEYIPVDLSFETLYERFLLLTKKRYIAYPVNKDGKRMGVTKKGVVLTRRDNSQFVRIIYKKITDGILDRKDEQNVMYELYDEIHKLFTKQVPDENLIIYVGVKKLIEYAKKKKFDIGGKPTEFYVDKDGDPIDDVVGPLDPRLVYTNIPQVILSLKLLKRGTDIPPNTRLEHIYLENKDAIHKGEKADDYTYYKENKDVEGFKPDYLLYLDSLQTPITELLNVKFPRRDIILYEKLEDAITRVFSDEVTKNIGEYKVCLLARTTKYTKNEYTCSKEGIVSSSEKVGWDALKKIKYTSKMKIPKDVWEDFINKKIIKGATTNRVYNYKGILAKVEYVLESTKKGGINDFSKDNETEKEIIKVCGMYKNRDLLTRIHSYHHVKKRPVKKPTQIGEKLIKGTKIYILKGIHKGEFGHVIDFKEIINEQGKKYKKYYNFTISIDETKELLEDVPRDYITSYFYRDDSIMKDIYTARLHYKSVVDDLNNLFNPIEICE